MKQRIEITPLSVNNAWKGQKFKTDKYKKYEIDCMYLIQPFTMPLPPYRVDFEFGLSNNLSDVDNPCKPFMDILQKKYGFNDSKVNEIHLYKKIVPKGQEYIVFEITSA